MKKLLCAFGLLLCFVTRSWATGEPSTQFNIYIPPSNEVMGRDVALVVTALYDSTTFNIIDDGADGDTDDSKTGVLMAGQSYVLYIRNNGVNDDAPHSGESATKNDGDYFTITSSKLVFASQFTKSDWQHDWVSSFNKTSKGQKFVVYSNPSSNATSKNDINAFAYQDSTMIVVRKVSTSALTGQGYTNVEIEKGTIVMQKMIHVGQDLLYTYSNGRNLLEQGETYVIESNKPITLQYGALYGNARDGGGYVPSANGSSAGELFYFGVPYDANGEQEIRVVSWDDSNNVQLQRYVNGAWTLVKNWPLTMAMKPADWIGQTQAQTFANVFRVTCTPGKKVSVFEANWLETGAPATSDIATMASSSSGTSSGQSFLVYMPPPSVQSRMTNPFTNTKLTTNTHAYVYAKDSCTVTVKDAYTGGTKLSRSYNIGAGRYADVNLTLNDWKSIYNGTGTTAGGPERPYLNIQSTGPISVMVANTNDNWMMYFGSALPQTFNGAALSAKAIAIPGDTVTVTNTVTVTGGAVVHNPNLQLAVGEGAIPVSSVFTDSLNNVSRTGTIMVDTGNGSTISFTGIPNMDSTNRYKITTRLVFYALGSDSKPVTNNDIISVDMYVGGYVNSTYEQASASAGITNNSANTSNYQFTKITTGTPVTDTTNSWNSCWVDYNGDNYQDLFTPSYDKARPNVLYLNLGNGTFAKVAANTPLTSNKMLSVVSAAFGDMDNDGKVECLTGANLNRASQVFTMGTSGTTFNPISAGALTNDSGYAQTVNLVDYDNDGKLDAFVSEYFPTKFCRLYHNNGNNQFSKVTTGEMSTIGEFTNGSTWADYDNDGLMDLFVPVGGTSANPLAKNNLLFHNDGNGQFTKVTTGAIVSDGGNSTGSTWGDYDNDGFLDLFVSNASNQSNFLYHNNGNGSFTKITSGEIVTTPGNWHGCSWVDYDNDGWLDLYVVSNDSTEAKKLYHNNGNGTFTNKGYEVVCAAVANTIGTSWGDYNRDGWQDLYVTTHGAKVNYLYKNNGGTKKWINIKLKGVISNQSAIGARVYVKANTGSGSRWQMRQINSTSGIGSQNEINASFGLNSATSIDSITVKWPSGIVQTLTNQGTNQFIQIIESAAGQVIGKVYLDANSNCTADAGETGIKSAKLKVTPGDMYIYTDSSGNFSTWLKTGSYTIAEVANAYWQPSCSTSYNVTVSTINAVNANLSFANTAIQNGVDLYLGCGASAFRRGFKNEVAVEYANHGSQTFTNAPVSVTFPEGITPVSSVPAWSSANGQTYTWNIAEIKPAGNGTIHILDSVGLSYSLNDSFDIAGTVPNPTDLNLPDNSFSFRGRIMGSLDPNELIVTPIGIGADGYINKSDTLTYTVNFQNLGNWEAENVYIEDELPQEIDLSTLRLSAASHNCQYSVQDRTLRVKFEGIKLPYKDANEAGSNGFVSFKVLPAITIAPQTRIYNEAVIGFDYEIPMSTGKVKNTIFSEYSSGHYNRLYIFPNPLTNASTVRATELPANVVLRDLSARSADGRMIFAKVGIGSIETSLQRSMFPTPGLYLITAHDTNGKEYASWVNVE